MTLCLSPLLMLSHCVGLLSDMGFSPAEAQISLNWIPVESMTTERKTNPFKIGDQVRFEPDDHAVGWVWPSFDRLRLQPGETGTVTRIGKDDYLYLDDDRGGFHWECFKSTV